MAEGGQPVAGMARRLQGGNASQSEVEEDSGQDRDRHDSDSADEGVQGSDTETADGAGANAESETEGEENGAVVDAAEANMQAPAQLQQLPRQRPKAKWTRGLTRINVDRFTEDSGPVELLPRETKEMDFLNLTFPERLYQDIADDTIRNARSQGVADKEWQLPKKKTIQKFIGFHMYMALCPLPSYKDYFSDSNDIFKSNIGLRAFGRREEYETLEKYFHVNDTGNNPPYGQRGHDALAHVRNVIDICKGAFRDRYIPARECSVDEAMIPFKGRLKWRQYIKNKPHKHGIKVWVLACPHNGYVHGFDIYTGKDNTDVEFRDGEPLGSYVVKRLTRNLVNKNHHVYMDNYFTSIPLFQSLLGEKIYACGTIRANRRGLPSRIKNTKLSNQGDYNIIQRGKTPLTAVTWKDKKQVYLLSTNADPTGEGQVQRKGRRGERVNIRCPLAEEYYQLHMNGVDRANQLRESYSTLRKSRKWWRYVFFYIWDTANVNALILMQESPNHERRTRKDQRKPITQLEFRRAICMSLLQTHVPGESNKRKNLRHCVIDKNSTAHWPNWSDKKGRCRECTHEGRRTEPRCYCEGCSNDGHGHLTHLCVACFKKYHIRMGRYS